ncbi:MAG: AAA family ATPase [Algisphaera sp.]
MRTIAIINQKGGCGKTTTSINLAAVMALKGKRTLLLDMDPQSHCALGLAVPDNQIERSTADLLRHGPEGGVRVADVTWQISRGLDLAPSSMALAGIEQQLANAPDKDRRLEQILHTVRDTYDLCIIDCPPGIGLLTFNALRAADEVLIPVETGYFAMQGAVRQEQTIEMMSRRVGHHVRFKVLPTMYDVRTKLAREILGELKKHFGERVLPIVINFNSKLKEAASFGQPITEYDAASRGMQDFDALANWLLDNPPAPQGTSESASQAATPQTAETAATASPSNTPAFADAPTRTAPTAPDPAAQPNVPVMSRAAELVQRAKALSSRNSELNQKIRNDNDQSAYRPLPPAPSVAPDNLTTLKPLPTPQEAAQASPTPTAKPVEKVAPPAPAEPSLKEKLAALYGVRLTSRGVLFVQPDEGSADSFSIAGDFNNWNPSQTPMSKDENLGVWRACVNVPAGRYRYRLVRDGQWVQDPFNKTVESNPFGELNNIIEIATPAPAAKGTLQAAARKAD